MDMAHSIFSEIQNLPTGCLTNISVVKSQKDFLSVTLVITLAV